MEFYVINEEYLNYLRSNEKRIPITDYGMDKYKPIFGVLFKEDGLSYVANLSSHKDKHDKRKANIDFIKVYDNSKVISVINLNYMFPVLDCYMTKLDYKSFYHQQIISGKDPIDANKYIGFLKKQENKITKMQEKICSNALKVYHLKYSFPDNDISKRCLDFKKLNELAHNYIEQ